MVGNSNLVCYPFKCTARPRIILVKALSSIPCHVCSFTVLDIHILEYAINDEGI